VYDGTTSHSREVVAEMDGFFEQSRQSAEPWKSARVYRPAVRRNVKLAEAPSFGKSIFEYDPSCPGSQDYGKLAETLTTEWDNLRERLTTKVTISSVGDPLTI
jgi:chromosome partitioning protein